MAEVGGPPFKKPQATFIPPPDVGGKYEVAVTTLVAAKLAIDPRVEDYHIFTNLKPVEPFDDVVARVLFKGDDTPHAYAIQVKHVNRGEKNLDVSKYLNGYSKMSSSEQFKEVMRDIPVHNIYFCYFCIKQPQKIIGYTPNAHNSANNSKLSALSFQNCYKLTCNRPTIEIGQTFLDQFYLYFDQPNIEAVDDEIKKTCKINDTKDILHFVDHFVTNKELQLNGLCKTIFESELLRIRLGDNIVTPPNIIHLNDSPIVIWNKLTLLHNVTIVKAEPQIEESLFGCLAHKLNRILNNTIDWNDHRTNALNSTVINEFKQLFIPKDSVKTRHWINPPNTLKSLIIELWKSGSVPLILRSNDDLPALKDYAHLNKNYIIITDNLVAKRKECEGYHLTTFTHVSDIKCFAVRDELLQSISVSLQGREPIPLYSIVNDHEPLIATLSCSCILHLMKARTAYLSKDYVDGDHHDNMIFLIEDPTVSVEYDIGDISRGTQNIAIRCRPEKIVECREKIKQNFNFSKEIYRCSASSEIENFSLIEGNKSPLRDFFVDQDGENVYNLGDNIVPILGCSLQNVQQNYISRFLRSAVVLKSLFDSQTKGICFFSGDLNNLDKNIKINVVKILLDKIEEKVQQLSSKNVFIDIGNEDINKYWEKASTFKRPLLHIRVDYDTGMQLCRYSDWKGLSDYISFSGREISEDNFLTKITDGITLVTGEPGIGKSSLLKSLFKDHGMEKYILFYNLAKYNLERKHKPSEPNYALSFLLNDLKKLRYSKFLYELCKSKKSLLILLDSFDEVLPIRKEDTLDFISNLAANNIQIIIASRLIANNIAVQKFEANIFKVDILRADDQEKYIRDSNLSEEMLANIPIEFLQNPLYLTFIKIISEKDEHLVDITRLKLFENIIKIKLNQYFKKYFSSDHKFDKEILLNYVQEVHQKLALTRILGLDIVKKLFKWKYEEKYIHQLKLGIVQSVAENSHPTFVHETFAEYLTANWLIKNKTESSAKEIYQELLKQKKLHVLDILCEHLVLHKAVLDKDYKEIKVCARKHSHLEKTDELGRTALHVAAAYYEENLHWGINYYKRFLSSRSILNEIIHNMCELKVSYSSSDFLMQWDWVQHLNCGNEISLGLLDIFPALLREAYLNYIIQKLRDGVRLDIHRDPPFDIKLVYADALGKCSINLIRSLLFIEDFLFKGLSQALNHQECQALERDALNLSKIHGFTPLHVACIYGNVEVVRTLINLNYDTNATDNFGCTPLHYGVINPFEVGTDMTTLLLENGSQTDIQNERGVSPTIMAIQSGNIDTAELLLKKCTLDPLKLHLLLLCEKYANRKRQFDARLPVPTVVPKGYFCRLVKLLLDRDINVDELCESDEFVISRGPGNKKNSYFRPGRKNTALMRAVEAGNAEIIELLLERGINVNSTTADDRTPLIVALESSWENSDCVKLLLERGANVNSTVDGKTPLILALESKFEKSNSVKLLLEGGANVNSTTPNGKTPLLLALQSSWENSDCVKLLLERGANVNSTVDGKTPLILALESKFEKSNSVKLLLEGGANVNSTTPNGKTPLLLALQSSWENSDCVKLLLERGANVNSTVDGKTPLILALESKFEKSNSVKLLLEGGANVNSTSPDGKTPLLLALQSSWVSLDCINLLLEKGANVNSTTRDGKTPLMFAVEYQWRSLEPIKFIVERGANINSETTDGKTPLMFALESDWMNLDCINLLLERGANVNSTTASGKTPLMFILESECEHFNCINLLLERGANVNSTTTDGKTPLMIVLEAEWVNCNCINLLLERGANVNSTTTDGKTALMFALESKWENHDCISLLLERGADVNSTTTDGKTPLMFALESWWVKLNCINLLLKKGANVNSTTTDGKTPLMLALEFEWENLGCINLLLRRGAQVNGRTIDGKTPLMFALESRWKNLNCIKLLLERGANVNSATIGGETPLIFALESDWENLDCISLLLERGANVNSTTTDGRTPLIFALESERRNLSCVNLLLERGADVNSTTIDGKTPLMLALEYELKNLNRVKSLLQRRTDVDSLPTDNKMRLIYDLKNECKNTGYVKLLLEKGADINSITDDKMLLIFASTYNTLLYNDMKRRRRPTLKET